MDGEKTLMDNVTVICPYIFYNETQELRDTLDWNIDFLIEEDSAKIGSDLMYQKLWNKCDPNDIFIMHADMIPVQESWLDEIKSYVNKYPEAGIFGCKLLYPAKTEDEKKYIQSAGGFFDQEGTPQHYGSGLDLFTQRPWKQLEIDEGQYDKVREVAWTTFGGVYIRRQVLHDVGDFDPEYEWSYNRDVDYCLEARAKGWKIYQIPVPILHFESKDNKRLKGSNNGLVHMEQRNLKRLKNKWADSPLYETINIEVT